MSKITTHKIVLADDHVVLRDALALVINAFDNWKVVAVAENGEEVLEIVESGNVPDVLLLDLSMPKKDGYETAAYCKTNSRMSGS